MSKRSHDAKVLSAKAECQQCHWRADAKNAQALAAQHHDRSGHRVRVETTTRIDYGAVSGSEKKNQGKLF